MSPACNAICKFGRIAMYMLIWHKDLDMQEDGSWPNLLAVTEYSCGVYIANKGDLIKIHVIALGVPLFRVSRAIFHKS